jgi:drug/metabolite transporter (DMT)-like permease
MPSKPLLPVIALLAAASFWGIFWFPLRLLNAHGLGGVWSSATIFGAATLVGWAGVWLNRQGAAGQHRALLALALASGWCNVAFIVAVIDGPVVRALLLFYLAPLWTVLLGRILLHERLSTQGRLTMALATVGAVIMLWDPAIGFPWPRGAADLLAVSAGFSFALSNVVLRHLQTVSVWLKSVLAWSGVAAVALLWILVGDIAPPHADAATWMSAVAIGTIGMVPVTVAVAYGITHMPAHRAAVLLLFELVVGAASAQWLTNEPVRANEWAGGALVVFAGWLATRSQMKSV